MSFVHADVYVKDTTPPACPTYTYDYINGTLPGNHKYKLKYYLKDRAGNVTNGMSKATSSAY